MAREAISVRCTYQPAKRNSPSRTEGEHLKQSHTETDDYITGHRLFSLIFFYLAQSLGKLGKSYKCKCDLPNSVDLRGEKNNNKGS